MLGLAMTLPMILLCGPLAGYLLSSTLIQQFGWPNYWIPVATVLGLLGSGLQSYRLIKKLKQASSSK
jgi:hypothetical protein